MFPRQLATRVPALAWRGAASFRPLHATNYRQAEDSDKTASGMTFNFTLPTQSLYEDASVEQVILPGIDGMFGVMPNHVPTVAELKPGVVSVQKPGWCAHEVLHLWRLRVQCA